ncbi:Zn-dependent peptidase ImmA (M78 family) [Hamadaea flava]|uniref:Helix-turn-helix domain-containing protein n=1 Tax=Hamadaea flava TaxID=1742688 RepID=A0ABV8LZ27_9ACTN|nr:XRE family transcriptional regulator [Hamadaea flava]MCP2326996.1 Zn-dependent peptidase ImmA (M78 family) [Hamadaea flava]
MRSDQPAAARLADVARLFSGRRLTLARQVSGLRKNGLAERIGKTATAVAAYESGSKRPAPSTVAELALTLGVDPSFFIGGRGDEAVTQTPHFRSLRTTTQLVRDQADAYGRLVHEIAIFLDRYVELPPRNTPRLPVQPDTISVDEPEVAAMELRKAWAVGSGPLGHLIRLAENNGVLVAYSIPQAVSIDAFSIDAEPWPLILLNPAKYDFSRQRFDVAHELGHLVMHSDPEPGNKIAEDQANRFAAEFLMPAIDIQHELPRKTDWPRLFELKERWGVSIQALLMRCRQLQVMNDTTYQRAMVNLSTKGWRTNEPGEGTLPEQPSLLARSVELLEEAGYDGGVLADQCRVPADIFWTATSRKPTFEWRPPIETANGGQHDEQLELLGVTDLESYRAKGRRSGAAEA